MCFKQVKAKTEIFKCDLILFLKNRITAIFELEYRCSVFTLVQYINVVDFVCAHILSERSPLPDHSKGQLYFVV